MKKRGSVKRFLKDKKGFFGFGRKRDIPSLLKDEEAILSRLQQLLDRIWDKKEVDNIINSLVKTANTIDNMLVREGYATNRDTRRIGGYYLSSLMQLKNQIETVAKMLTAMPLQRLEGRRITRRIEGLPFRRELGMEQKRLGEIGKELLAQYNIRRNSIEKVLGAS